MSRVEPFYCKECGQELPEGAPRRQRARPGGVADAGRNGRFLVGGILAVLAVALIAAIVVLGNRDASNDVASTPDVTIASSSRATLSAAGASFSQRLQTSNEAAREAPLDLSARRTNADKDLSACERFQTTIGEVVVPPGMRADMQALIDATTEFCTAIAGVAAATDDSISTASEEQLRTGLVWNDAFGQVVRQIRRFS